MTKNALVFRRGNTTYIPLGEKTFALTDTGSSSIISAVPDDAVESISASDDNKGKTPTYVREILKVVALIAIELDL